MAQTITPELQAAPAAAGVPDVAAVAAHMDEVVQYIERAYPDAKMLDRGPILRNLRRWSQRLRNAQPAAQPQAEPWGWSVVGTRYVFFGEDARDDAEREARHCGGSARALPLYTAPPAAVDLEQFREAVSMIWGWANAEEGMVHPSSVMARMDELQAMIDRKAVRKSMRAGLTRPAEVFAAELLKSVQSSAPEGGSHG